MEELSRKVLPQGFSYEWTGLSLEELESAGTAALLFGLGTLVVYLTLSAQYESFVLPFIVLLAVPMALLGALGAQWLRGLQNDVYCQIGLVMLVGLASKNAILIVEFAEQLRERGLLDRGRRGRGGAHPAAADPDDLVRLHPGRGAAGARQRRRPGGPALGGHDRVRRHDRLDAAEPVLHPGAVPGDRGARGSGAARESAAEGDAAVYSTPAARR